MALVSTCTGASLVLQLSSLILLQNISGWISGQSLDLSKWVDLRAVSRSVKVGGSQGSLSICQSGWISGQSLDLSKWVDLRAVSRSVKVGGSQGSLSICQSGWISGQSLDLSKWVDLRAVSRSVKVGGSQGSLLKCQSWWQGSLSKWKADSNSSVKHVQCIGVAF